MVAKFCKEKKLILHPLEKGNALFNMTKVYRKKKAWSYFIIRDMHSFGYKYNGNLKKIPQIPQNVIIL